MPVTIDRRGALATTSAATSFLLSGCLGALSTGSAGDEAEDVRTERYLLERPSPGDGDPVVRNGLTGGRERRRRAWLVRTESEAAAVDADRLRELGADEARSLVTETDFSSAFVLIVQVLLPSRDLTLALDGVRFEEHDATTVRVALSAGDGGTAVGGGAGESALATLFVRCTPDRSRTVDGAVVTYDGPGPAGNFDAEIPTGKR